MHRRLMALTASCIVAYSGSAWGQGLGGADAAGAAGTTAAGAGAGAAGAVGEAAPKNIWSRLLRTPEQRARARARFCNSPAGQLVNSLLQPVSGLTGGLIKPLCTPAAASAANLKKPADSAQGAAARIKAEEAEAKAKIADIEYLGTKNCKRYPEAEAALVNALRAEKNECVRLAAARALTRGCCCTPKIMKALTMTVNMSTKDTFPAEESERVRLMAYLALEKCMAACSTAEEEAPEKPSEKDDAEKAAVVRLSDGEILPATYYTTTFPTLSPNSVIMEARAALAAGLRVSGDTIDSVSPRNIREMISPQLPPAQPSRPLIEISRVPGPAALPMPSAAAPRQPRSLTGIIQASWAGDR